MQWTPEAEEAIKKVPFFVRQKVRARVEKEALSHNKAMVTLAEVKATQKRYLTGMAAEVKGYQLDACFGPSGCPSSIAPTAGLVDEIEVILKSADFLGFLKSKGISDFKFHHEFRVTVAECPNACSQPQIKDIGIIAAQIPEIGEAPCTACDACAEACRDSAITIDQEVPQPEIDWQQCMACGQCIAVCPTGTLSEAISGYRIQLGGKLGRHPQLARELPGIYSASVTLTVVSACIDVYKSGCRRGERFGEVLKEDDFQRLIKQFGPKALDHAQMMGK